MRFTAPIIESDYRESAIRQAGRITIVIVAAALACFAILFTFEPSAPQSLVVKQFIGALVYSGIIGGLSAFSLHVVGNTALAQRRGFKVVTPVLVLLATNTVGCLLAGLVMMMLGLITREGYWPRFTGTLPFGAVITLMVGLSMYFYYVLQSKLERASLELRTRQMEQERVGKLAAEAQLSSLESRIHPHFLFNTLNSIASLIPQDPKRAEAMVTKLASLLRFSLNASKTGLVPLSQELTVVRNYLEIEQARFGPRLRYSIQVQESLESLGVPPLSVQSLVENSVKHVIANCPHGGEIGVTATMGNGCAYLDVSDSGPGFELETVPSGHGIQNLTDRLALLYGPAARLEVDNNGGHATVRVIVPQET